MKKHQDGRHLGPWMTSTEQSSLTSIDDGGRRERSIWFKSLYLGKGLSFFPSFFFIFYSGVAQYHRLRPQDHMCLSSLLSNPCPSPSPVHPTSLPSPGKVLALCVLQLPPAFISHLLLSEPPDVLSLFFSNLIVLSHNATPLLKTSDVSPLLTEGQDTICSHHTPTHSPYHHHIPPKHSYGQSCLHAFDLIHLFSQFPRAPICHPLNA